MTTIVTHTGIDITFSSFVFSGGEIQVKILNTREVADCEKVTITAHLTDTNKIFELALLTDAIRRINPAIAIDLVCPYLPAARQDRVCDSGEALSLKVITTFINSLNFNLVTVWDVHSDVSLALLDRVHNVGPEHFLDPQLDAERNRDSRKYVLVSPDAGAVKKVTKVAKQFNLPMITASKIRDPKTGEISGTEIHLTEESLHKTFLIVDDICDGGRTFTELAKAIQRQHRISAGVDAKIELYVTHGIFSKGVDIFEDVFNVVYTANLFPNLPVQKPLVVIGKEYK